MKELLVLCIVLGIHQSSVAQNKMDLDDLSIQGELHNDDRLKMIAREKNRLKNFVKYRTDFKAEMIEGLPKPEPKQQYEN